MARTSSKVLANREATDPHANRLLGLPSPEDYRRLRPHLHRVALEYRQAAASTLKGAGLIRYKLGNVTIIDRRGLIRRSCECYGVSKNEFDRLLGKRALRKVRSGRT